MTDGTPPRDRVTISPELIRNWRRIALAVPPGYGNWDHRPHMKRDKVQLVDPYGNPIGAIYHPDDDTSIALAELLYIARRAILALTDARDAEGYVMVETIRATSQRHYDDLLAERDANVTLRARVATLEAFLREAYPYLPFAVSLAQELAEMFPDLARSYDIPPDATMVVPATTGVATGNADGDGDEASR